jgi:excisionase family DNA binding protein
MEKISADLHQAQTICSANYEEDAQEVQPLYLTYRQAETLTGLSRTTLWKLINGTGGVRAARVGRAVRIHRRSLEEYMERAANVG